MDTPNTDLTFSTHRGSPTGSTDAQPWSGVPEMIATAMAADPVHLWATEGIGPSLQRQEAIVGYYRLLIASGLHGDGLLKTVTNPPGERVGVALWLPSQHAARDHHLRFACGIWQHGQRWQQLHKLLGSDRPPGTHQLAVIAVHPGAQGYRLGRALLRSRLDELDAARTATYADATSTTAKEWLGHHGFRPLGSIHLPDGGPQVWRMYRDPTTTTPHPPA